jgi:NAD(P)-dependent dehydrogenase (short-subunit alcohol dehydrogenase family)
VITGAGSGLGRESALLFAGEGAKLILAEVDADRAAAVEKEVTAQGGVATAVATDVSVESDVERCVETTLAEYGRLDVYFSNAGVRGPKGVPLEDYPEEAWHRVLDVNLMGTFFGCKHSVKPMREQGGGSIVITSSAAALRGYPDAAIYGASKGGISALVSNLAVDLGGWNIRINSICAGTGMSANFLLPPGSPLVDEGEKYRGWDPSKSITPLVRPVPPRLIDHARLALFLASDESSFLTGLNIPSDGGATTRVYGYG